MNKMSVRALLLGLGFLAACGGTTPQPPGANGCKTEAGIDTYSAGMAKSTDVGGYTLKIMSSTRIPPDRGANQFSVQILDGASMPVATATASVKPFMPDHGHGSTPATFPLVPTGGGAYDVGPINFFMPGRWDLNFRIDSSDGQRAEAKFSFCVEG
ncbi:MAG: FixH family protein [Myxococcota bacterium]